MKTPDEIKNGLEHCRNDAPCLECEYADQRDRRYTCEDALLSDALAYIEQLEMLAKLNEQVRWERDVAIDQLKQLGIGFGEKIEAQVPKWISVEERLPENSGRYIVRFPSGNIDSVTYSRVHNAFNASDMLSHKNNAMPVTHWMPLPKPPKEG